MTAAQQTKRRGRPKATPPNRHDVKRKRPQRPRRHITNPCAACGKEQRKPNSLRCPGCSSHETGPARDAERVARQLAKQGGEPLPLLGDLLPGTRESIELERLERREREYRGE